MICKINGDFIPARIPLWEICSQYFAVLSQLNAGVDDAGFNAEKENTSCSKRR
jgi:hypothetical protein